VHKGKGKYKGKGKRKGKDKGKGYGRFNNGFWHNSHKGKGKQR
jgi:hypothetical protein